MSEPDDIAPREQAIVLGYGPARRSAGWRRRVLQYAVALIVVGGVFYAAITFQNGTISLACEQCSATNRQSFVSILGHAYRYRERKAEGIISQFVQRAEGHPCSHRWVMADESVRGFRGHGATGAGLAYWRWANGVGGNVGLDSVLDRRVRMNPKFAATLIHAVRHPFEDDSQRLYQELFDEVISFDPSATTALSSMPSRVK